MLGFLDSSLFMGVLVRVVRLQKIKKSIGSSDLPNIYLITGELSNSQLNELYKSGVITKEEFKKAKEKILN